MTFGAILLSGGTGTRMQSETPKQFLPLLERHMILYSLDILQKLPEIQEIIVVCDPKWHGLFPSSTRFALPGQRRQDSVFSGLQALQSAPDYVLIHDGARPLVTEELCKKVMEGAINFGAAAPAVAIKSTIKEASIDGFVKKTLDRSFLYELQTPQGVRLELLMEGYNLINKHSLDVTDDVSIVEQIGHPVKLVAGDPNNLKITLPIDLIVAENILLHSSALTK